jgi:hypothetical protein
MDCNCSDTAVWRVRTLTACRRSVTLLNPSVYKHRSLRLALISFLTKKETQRVVTDFMYLTHSLEMIIANLTDC